MLSCLPAHHCTPEVCSRQTVPNPKNSVIKRKTLSLTVGSAFHALLILSNYTVQTITINKSTLRKLIDNSGVMVSLLPVDLNEENSRKQKFLLLYFGSSQKELPQGKLPHSRQQFKWYRCTQNTSFSFCLPMGNAFTTST